MESAEIVAFWQNPARREVTSSYYRLMEFKTSTFEVSLISKGRLNWVKKNEIEKGLEKGLAVFALMETDADALLCGHNTL